MCDDGKCTNECKICGARCDAHGNFEHSKGCYEVSADGGGYSKCYCDCHPKRLTRRERNRAREQQRQGLRTPLVIAWENESCAGAAAFCLPGFKPVLDNHGCCFACGNSALLLHEPCNRCKYGFNRQAWRDAGTFIDSDDRFSISAFLQAFTWGDLRYDVAATFRERYHHEGNSAQRNLCALEKRQREYVVPQATLDRQALKRELKRERAANRKRRDKDRRKDRQV